MKKVEKVKQCICRVVEEFGGLGVKTLRNLLMEWWLGGDKGPTTSERSMGQNFVMRTR